MRENNRKRPGLRRFQAQQLPDHDDDEQFSDDNNEDDDSSKEPARRRQRTIDPEEEMKEEEAAAVGEARQDSDEEIQMNFPFCCAVCHCSEEKKKRTIIDDTYCFLQGNEDHYHRCCCHDGKIHVAAAQAELEELDDDDSNNDRGDSKELFTARDVQRFISNANRKESKMFATDESVVPSDEFLTNTHYAERVVKDFYEETKKREERKGLVVLDLFGGVGTALLVLKRLKLPIRKVIHVEHDLVATFVSRMNHDYAFVNSLRQFACKKRLQFEGLDGGYMQLSEWKIPDDGIEHVYYRRFEDIFDPVGGSNDPFKAFAEDHVETDGIDLVIGGPPCVDYCAVNANRKGTEGRQGKYLVQTGQLCQAIQKHQYRKLYVMVENVFISSQKERTTISNAFGFQWEPLELDAWQVSPGARKRHFFINIPYSDTKEGHDCCGVTPESCLDDGYSLPQMLIEDYEGEEVPRRIKANTFMASYGRLGDDRMFIFKEEKENGKRHLYSKRIYSVTERERIMGYPEGYVSKPVSMLFEILWYHGYARFRKYVAAIKGQPREKWPLANGWREMLPPELHDFAGNFLGPASNDATPFRNEPSGFSWIPPKVKLAPPPNGKTLTYFNDEQYAMRLIGNAFSVPAVEQVLRRLKELYTTSDEQRCEELFRHWLHPYKWETPGAAEETMLDAVEETQDAFEDIIIFNEDDNIV